MKPISLSLAVVISLATLLGAQSTSNGVLILTHANVIDGLGSSVLMNATVVVRDGRIERVTEGSSEASAASSAGAADAEVIDLQGKYLLPGLIDAHVHLRGIRNAEKALRSGVTTARSMGTAHFTDVGLRELGREGAIDSPEILAAGYHVRPTPSSELFIDEPGLADLMAGVRGPDAFRRVTEVNIRHRVDWIKITSTERAGLSETDPRKQTMSEEEIAAVVDEAGRSGIPVAAHAHGDEGARAAVRAGVRSIEHGTYLTTTTLELMKEKGTFLVPTVAVVTDLAAPGGDYDDPFLQVRGRHMLTRLREVVREAHAMQIPIAAATDTGFGPEGVLRLQHEVEELVKCGLSPMEAIRAATATAARLLGVDGRTGTIRSGLEADLIAVERNPLEDIVALQDILLVVHNGKVVVDRTSFALPSSSE